MNMKLLLINNTFLKIADLYKESCLLWMFRNYTDQKFDKFYRACYNFLTTFGGFLFFQLLEIDHFKLDLLKRSDT